MREMRNKTNMVSNNHKHTHTHTHTSFMTIVMMFITELWFLVMLTIYLYMSSFSPQTESHNDTEPAKETSCT